MNEGYLRQRRNLISASIVILVVVLGGTKINPLYPFHFERPYVAELFMWIGFSYFWYRTKIYSPIRIFHQFKTEIIISYIREYNYDAYNLYNLISFVGTIRAIREKENNTTFKLTGIVESTGKTVDSGVDVPVSLNKILNPINYIKNLLTGKVLTDFYLPHVLALIALAIGIYKHQDFFPAEFFNLAPVLIVAHFLYSAVSIKKQKD